MSPAKGDPYDQLPYTDHAYAETHPDRLSVVALLSGFAPPAVERARILELGCGRGGNLLPMAAGLPNATLVGVDRSRRQIEEARRIAAEASLTNLTFNEESFEAAHLAPASFDFVLCHGVYSWVPLASRTALLAAIARALAPGGIAYVSFNALPGWYERMAARDWLRTGAAGDLDARASLAWLAEHVSPELGAYRKQLERVNERLRETDPAYLVHEYLAHEHHPELVSRFLVEASEAGLAYLGDAIPATTARELLAPEVAARIQDLSVSDAQQVIDFVRNAAFRRALLVRSEDSAARGFRAPPDLDVRAVASLRIASRLSSPAPDQFDGPDGSVHVFDPHARRALNELARVAPLALTFDEIAAHAFAGAPSTEAARHALAAEFLSLWLATGALDFHAFSPRLARAISLRPEASAVARWHAAHGGALTNAWHQGALFPDALVRLVLSHADGQRTIDELERVVQQQASHAFSPADVAALVKGSLDLFAAAALLIS